MKSEAMMEIAIAATITGCLTAAPTNSIEEVNAKVKPKIATLRLLSHFLRFRRVLRNSRSI